MNINFCVTFTTIPSRINTIYKTIKSIEKQSIKPNKIFLNIPIKYHRFPDLKINDSEIKKIKSDLVQINRCSDFGPGTKIMGSLNEVKKYDCAVIIDDDHIYNPKMCEIFINEFLKKKNNYSFYIQKIFNLNMGQCADGFLINCSELNEIEKFYEKYVENNKNFFLDDDLWISIYLQIIKKGKILNLIDKFKKETNKELVYEIHATLDALSNDVHNPKNFLNRRKIAKLEYIKFLIKNYFSNFNQ